MRQEEAISLRNKLRRNGFTSAPVISPIIERRNLPHGKHLPEMYKNGTSVEVHFKLFEQKGNSLTEEMLINAYDLQDESNIYYPEPQIFFLYLVKHLDEHEKEGTSQIRLYTDLAELLSHHSGIIINRQLINKANSAMLKIIFLLFLSMIF